MIDEALKVVEELNDEIYDFLNENYGESFLIFELCTDGNSITINFMRDYQLWNSDEDEREFYEDKNEYEPLGQYLRREAQERIDQISNIKLIAQNPCPQCIGCKEEIGSRFCGICGRDFRAFKNKEN